MTINAVRLNHAVLYVSDPARSISFYEAAFDMQVEGRDPDGNEFEVMWMLPRAEWGAYENAAPVEHLDLVAEVTKWSGVRTASELVPLDPR